jgi:hypothetical protein
MGHDGRLNRARAAVVEQARSGAEAPERGSPPISPGGVALDDFVIEI